MKTMQDALKEAADKARRADPGGWWARAAHRHADRAAVRAEREVAANGD